MTHLPPPGISVDARDLRVAFLSDSLPERNGTGAYYQDLATHLRRHLDAVSVLQPRPRGRFDPLSVPMPGDPTQRLVIPDVRRIRRTLDEQDPHVIISVTPGPFGLLGPSMARCTGVPLVTAYHTHFAGLAALYWGPLRRRLANAPLQAANRYLCQRSATVLVNNTQLAPAVRAPGGACLRSDGNPS
jgi:hypothetical protein